MVWYTRLEERDRARARALMGSDLNRKNSHVWIRILVVVLLAGVAFRFFVSSSHLRVTWPDYVHRAFVAVPLDLGSDNDVEEIDQGDVIVVPNIPKIVSNEDNKYFQEVSNSTALGGEDSTKEECDIFRGEWVPSTVGPPYTNATCRFIEDPQNCMKNGRSDTEFLFYKWKPYQCDVPSFDAKWFLELMRNKSWALVGDSILRNHVQSLLCLLSKAEDPEETYHDETFKSRKWHFKNYNFTLSLIWTPFLVQADIFENDDGYSKRDLELHLDILDKNWTVPYRNFDYVIISTGQWFLKTAIYWENGAQIGCHYCKGKNLTDVEIGYAFKKTLRSVFEFVGTENHKPIVFYRTWTPDHFENGEWWSGGTCNRTKPYKSGEYDGKDVDKYMRRIEQDEFYKAINSKNLNLSNLKLLDTFDMSLLRPDGHAGPFRTFHPFDESGRKKVGVVNDCLHWCLPGSIDTWNDLLMYMLVEDK